MMCDDKLLNFNGLWEIITKLILFMNSHLFSKYRKNINLKNTNISAKSQ